MNTDEIYDFNLQFWIMFKNRVVESTRGYIYHINMTIYPKVLKSYVIFALH